MTTPKYYWEDFQVGEITPIGSFSLSEEEIISFARQYDPQPFHIDPGAAKESFYGGIIASGWHTCCAIMRLMVDSYLRDSASLGSPGVDEVRWLKPVRPGDVISARRVCIESRASASRPEMGVVKNRWEAINQHGETVLSMVGYGMFRRRNPGAGA